MLLLGQILAQAGMLAGRQVCWMPSYGPEMRGGTASCSVTIADAEIGSPLIQEPTVLVAMNGPSVERFGKDIAKGGTLIYNRPMGAFLFSMKVGVLSGLLIASPFVFSQLWLFIAPGLYSNEKRFAVPFVLFGTIFFIGGAAFSHYVAFPYTWKFFLGFETQYLEFRPKISDVFSLWVKMLLAFGVIRNFVPYLGSGIG